MLVVCLLVLIFLSLYWSVDTGSNHVGCLFVGSNIPKSLLECCTGSVIVCVLEHMFVSSSVCKPLLKCCGRFSSCWCSE